MDIRFLFRDRGVTPREAAKAARRHISTAYRWRNGEIDPDAEALVALRAAGLLTTADLRAGGVEVIR